MKYVYWVVLSLLLAVVVSTTNVTTTATPTPTPSSTIVCFNVSSTTASVCSGNGNCVSNDNCQCTSSNFIGQKCQTNVQSTATSFTNFGTSTNQSIINTDAANTLPGTSGSIPYTFTDNKLILSASLTSGQRKSICLNPSLPLVGTQSFVSFNLPSLPTKTGIEVWLQSASTKNRFSTTINFNQNSAGVYSLSADTSTSIQTTIKANTTYMMLFYVAEFGNHVSSQLITSKNEVINALDLDIYDSSLLNSLLNDEYRVCISMVGLKQSRSLNAVNNVTMEVNYYGKSKLGAIGSIVESNPKTTSASPTPTFVTPQTTTTRSVVTTTSTRVLTTQAPISTQSIGSSFSVTVFGDNVAQTNQNADSVQLITTDKTLIAADAMFSTAKIPRSVMSMDLVLTVNSVASPVTLRVAGYKNGVESGYKTVLLPATNRAMDTSISIYTLYGNLNQTLAATDSLQTRVTVVTKYVPVQLQKTVSVSVRAPMTSSGVKLGSNLLAVICAVVIMVFFM